MRTAEEIAFLWVGCTCDEAYKSRQLDDPNCAYHSTAVVEAIEAAQKEAWNDALREVKNNFLSNEEVDAEIHQLSLNSEKSPYDKYTIREINLGAKSFRNGCLHYENELRKRIEKLQK